MFDNKSVFSKEFLDRAFDLSYIGINEIAWKSDDALLAVNILAEKGYAILGGDVYSLVENKIKSTYDSWYHTKEESTNWKQYVIDSREKAISYIEFYSKRNGDSYCYSAVYTDELHYMFLKK